MVTRPFALVLVASLLAMNFAAANDPARSLQPAPDWTRTAREGISALEYHFTTSEGCSFAAPNRAEQLRTQVTAAGIEVTPRTEGEEWRVKLTLVAFGRDGALVTVAPATLSATGNRIELARGNDLVEWYVNDAKGLEQGFSLAVPPAGEKRSKPVVLEMSASGAMAQFDGETVRFTTASGEAVLRYGALIVRDACGEAVPAQLALDVDRVRIVIDDRAAIYPLLVDPVMDSPVWIGEGGQDGASYGYSATTAGDVNGDGYSDVIVGAYLFDNGQTDEGKAFLYLGSATGPALSPAWTGESNQASAYYGFAVAPAGDVNGDGYADVLVSAVSYDNGQTDEGRAFVYLGSATGLSASSSWTAESNQSAANFGLSFATAGDTNGDGFDDVIVGAPYYDGTFTDEGRAYVFTGSASGLSPSGYAFNNRNQANSLFGFSVSTAGDVNADGYADFIVGARLYDWGPVDTGAAFVYAGSPSGYPEIWNHGWLTGAGAQFGFCVANAGDVNGDGYGDVLVGAPFGDVGNPLEGIAYIFPGVSWGVDFGWTFLRGSNVYGAEFGRSVATAGDVNGDGYADILVGARCYSNPDACEGAVFLYEGAPNWPGTAILVGEGNQGSANYGISVATAGDVNGDGFSDVLVGAFGYDNGNTDEGAAFLYLGKADNPGEADPNTFSPSFRVANAGDINGDGFGDLLVGNPLWNNCTEDLPWCTPNPECGGGRDCEHEGEASLFLGSANGPVFDSSWLGSDYLDRAGLGDVSGAGDLNGDGYSDFLIGANQYVRVLYGSPAGASTPQFLDQQRFPAGVGDVNGDGYGDAVTVASADSAYLHLGSGTGLDGSPDLVFSTSVFDADAAGDVNGDGYSDVLILTDYYTSPSVSIYLGDASGLGSSAWWSASVGIYSDGAASAGDFNGDGFGDIVLTSNETTAAIYLGSPTSLTYDSDVVLLDLPINLLGCVGDVNADGFSDLGFGFPTYDADKGAALVLFGAVDPVDGWFVEGAYPPSSLGRLGCGVDVNGDGYSDLFLGAFRLDPFTGLTLSHVQYHYGNSLHLAGGLGPRRSFQQWRTDNVAPVDFFGTSDSQSSFQLKGTLRTAEGRTAVRMQWEAKPYGTPFDGTGLQQSSQFDTGPPQSDGSHVSSSGLVTGLAPGQLHHWRARIVSASPFFPRSPWMTLGAKGPQEGHIRTPLDTCDVGFQTFGAGLAGSGGFIPALTGTGSSCNQGGHVIHIAQGLGRANAQLWAGIGQADLPFFGGHFYINFGLPWIMVPIKLLGTPGVPGAGYLDIPGANVNAYTGLTLYIQVSVVDPGAIHGVALTNALQMTISQ